MKNEAITYAWNKLDPSDVVKKRIYDKIDERQMNGYKGRKQVLRHALLLPTVAAVVCLAVLGYVFLTQSNNQDTAIADPTNPSGYLAETPDSDHETDETNEPNTHPPEVGALQPAQNTNSFRLLAYASYTQGDGVYELREADIISESRKNASGVSVLQGYGYYASWENVWYSNIGLLYEGENISKVEFSVDEGFIGRQKLDESFFKLQEPAMAYVLFFRMDNVEYLGSKVVFEEGFLSQSDLLMWGIETSEDLGSVPSEVTIRAKAIFLDDTYAEQEVTLDVLGAVTAHHQREEERLARQAYLQYCNSLSLDDCELLEDSIIPVTDTYEYYSDKHRRARIMVSMNEGFESTLGERDYFILDCNPYFRSDEDRGYMIVIKRDDDGSLIGMIYRTPPQGAE